MYRTIIVDDEVDISRGMTTIVNWEEIGFEISGTAENGRQAMELFHQVCPHLVITDIKMPLMDGLELTQSLKRSSPDLQVLLISGYSDFEYAKQAIKYGVNNYLLKPVDVPELQSELAQLKKSLDNLHLCINSIKSSNPTGCSQKNGNIEEIITYIIDHCAEDLSLNKLSEVFYLNPFYIGKLIKKQYACTFNEYLNYVRIENTKYMLRNTNLAIHEIFEMAGYKFPDHFYRNFKKYVTVSPKEYRECQRG